MERNTMARVLLGSEVAEAISLRISGKIDELGARGITPCLTTVRVGELEDAIAYERTVTKGAVKAGLEVRNLVLPKEIEQQTLIDEISRLNCDTGVHGILLFNPLPKHIDERAAHDALAPAKDIDGVTTLSHSGVYTGEALGFAPCTPSACMSILDHYGIDVAGKHAVVIGRSLVVGKPLAMMLLSRNATVTVCHSKTTDLASIARDADILIACIGRAKMIDAQYLSEGQVVIDVGINVCEDGKIVGDVDFDTACNIVAAITPVPGGVGTVTSRILIEHVVDAALKG